MNETKKAGEGEHHKLVFPSVGADTMPLKKSEHYIAIDAMSWFVNKESGWFADYMVSGILTLTINGGDESYTLPLGIFELNEGARIAPVFDKPILPDRVYRGGPITIRVQLIGFKRNTPLAKLLKCTASSVIAAVGGIVQTATLAGPYAPFVAAEKELVNGLREYLEVQDGKFHVFDPNGFEFTIRPNEIRGPETFVLLHRGADIKSSNISISESGEIRVPLFEGQPLADGAWLLLRFRRAHEYPVERPWYQQTREFATKLTNLVNDVKRTTLSKKDALKELVPSNGSKRTYFDEYRTLYDTIRNDGALTPTEGSAWAGELMIMWNLVDDAIRGDKLDEFVFEFGSIRTELMAGRTPGGNVAKLLQEEQSIANKARLLPEGSDTQTLSGIDPAIATFLPFKYFHRLHDTFKINTP